MVREAASRVPRAPGPIIAIFMVEMPGENRGKKDHGFR